MRGRAWEVRREGEGVVVQRAGSWEAAEVSLRFWTVMPQGWGGEREGGSGTKASGAACGSYAGGCVLGGGSLVGRC